LDWVPLASVFTLVALAELGDKTQIASITLAAQFASPVQVFAGVMLAFLLITGIGVLLGTKLLRLLPIKYLRMGTAALFIIFGALFIMSSITGISIF
jgi:putative Ca2+/H+ antiporter (TMEM165/GDT1 family)